MNKCWYIILLGLMLMATPVFAAPQVSLEPQNIEEILDQPVGPDDDHIFVDLHANADVND